MSPGIWFLVLFFFIGSDFNTAFRDQAAYEAEDNFEGMVKSKYFVDKSLIIQEIFKLPEKILITAPSGWGKSTNLKMIKQFLELEISEEGHILSKATRKRHLVNDTNNYNIFIENSLKITQNKKLMYRHFGKYPIIHVDFKCQHKIKDSESSVICFREIIHNAIAKHKYLCLSEKLTLKEKRFVKKWSNIDGDYEEFYGQDVTKALHKFAILLDKQFGGRKIFVLIDNYDHPSADAMIRVKDGKELNRVMKFNLNIISTILNSDNKYQCRSVVLGKSYITAAGIYRFKETEIYRFLGNHTIQKYFGLSKNEVEKLFADSRLGKNEISFFHAFYGGFVSLLGDCVYGLHSTLSFLETRIFKVYSGKSNFMRYLKVYCKINFIRSKIEVLSKGNNIEMDSEEVFTINDLINLRDILTKDKTQERINENILFNFLLEQGYLTNDLQFIPGKSSVFSFKLPNLEVQTMVGQKLKKYYDEIYLPQKALLSKCVDFFKSVTPSLTANPIQFKRALYWFYTTFEKLIKFRWTRFSEKYVYRLLYSIAYHLGFKINKDSFVTVSEINDQFNCLIVDKKLIFVVGLRVNVTSKNVLENLMGRTLNSNFNLIPSLSNKKLIYMGLGVDCDLILSVSCLPKGNDTKNALHLP